MAGAVKLTGERVRAIADRIRRVFERHGVRIEHGPLAHNLADLDWLGKEDGDVFRPGGPHAEDRSRADQATAAIIRLKLIAQALDECSGLPGFERTVRHLRNLYTDLADPQAIHRSPAERQAWDLFVEVEVAALLSASGYEIRMHEPDVVIVIRGWSQWFGLACKRPQSIEGIRHAVADAGGQILRYHPAGLVVVCVDSILAGDDLRASYVVHKTTKQVDAECMSRLNRVLEHSAEFVAMGLADGGGGVWPKSGAIGVMMMATFVVSADHADKSFRYLNSKTLTAVVPSLQEAGAPMLMVKLGESVALGQEVFRDAEW